MGYTPTEAEKYGELIAKIYNEKTNIPFPFWIIPATIAEMYPIISYHKKKDMPRIVIDTLPLLISPRSYVIFHTERQRDGYRACTIKVRHTDSRSRQCLIAIGMAHYFMTHPSKETLDDDEAIHFPDTFAELQMTHRPIAEFASALLIPRERAKQVWAKVQSPEDFAKFWMVPLPMAIFRLNELGFI